MPQPSEDDKAQFRQDLPCALHSAPRLGAVSQFPHSPGRFTMIRPEVEVRSASSIHAAWLLRATTEVHLLTSGRSHICAHHFESQQAVHVRKNGQLLSHQRFKQCQS